MNKAFTLLRAVAAARAAGEDPWSAGGTTVQRVAGGFNNALYRVETGEGHYGVKLFVPDDRQRASREYDALWLMHAEGLDIAPEPLWLNESCAIVPLPAVAYRWLPGDSVGPSPTEQQLAALLDSVHSMHSLRPEHAVVGDLLDAWFHWFDFVPYLAGLRRLLSRYGRWLATTEPDGPDLRDRLARLVDECIEAVEASTVELGYGYFPLCLCRVDLNLANTVWGADGRLRWVDWEYSGWGDPALDVAELRWHSSLSDLSEDRHAWLRENYRRPDDDPDFGERLAVWDRIVCTRWPFLILRALWSVYNGPDRVRLSQPVLDPVVLRDRVVRFIERAEHLVSS